MFDKLRQDIINAIGEETEKSKDILKQFDELVKDRDHWKYQFDVLDTELERLENKEQEYDRIIAASLNK